MRAPSSIRCEASRLRRRKGGFTLIEIVVTLFIVMVILGTAVFSIDAVMEEGRLQREATAVKLAGRKCLRAALSERRSYTVTFTPTYFTIAPTYPDPVPEPVTAPQRRRSRRAEQLEAEIPAGIRHNFEEGMLLTIRRWGETTWRLPVEGGDRWVFEPSGICEPLSIRLTHEDSFIEMTFNPLTAHVAQEDEIRYVR